MGSSANATAFYQSIIGSNPEEYQTEYQPADLIASLHVLPRFSHTDDFSQLFSSMRTEQKHYGLSLLFVGVLIVSFFFVWGFLISLFKCLGRKRVGVFSGHPYAREGCFSTTGRAIYLFSALCVFVFSILITTQGVADLDFATDTIDATNQDVATIRLNLLEISTNLQSVSRDAYPVRDELVDFLEMDVCPLQPNSQLESDIRQISASTLAAMIDLDNFINNELLELDSTMEVVERANEDIQKGLDHTKFTGGASAAILIPYTVIPCFFLVALALGWCGYYSIGFYVFLQWVILPLFVLMVIFAVGATGFSAAAAEANADFCSGGQHNTPEGSIQRILSQHGISTSSFYHKIVTFYSNQCQTDEDPWNFLQVYYEQLNTAKARLDSFTATINDATVEQVSQECGLDYDTTVQLMNQMQAYTEILLDSSGRSLSLMSCQNIVPLYTSTVHDGVCDHAVRGATWVFSGFFVMAFFGTVILMLRGAYYPIYYYDFDEKSLGYTSSEDEQMRMRESRDDVDVDDDGMYAGNGQSAGDGRGFVVEDASEEYLVEEESMTTGNEK